MSDFEFVFLLFLIEAANPIGHLHDKTFQIEDQIPYKEFVSRAKRNWKAEKPRAWYPNTEWRDWTS